MSTHYVFHTSVISVTERKEQYNHRRNPDDNSTLYDIRSLGWFVRITESSAIFFGMEKPELEPGDKIKITIEKV